MKLTIDSSGAFHVATMDGEFSADDAHVLADELHPLVAPVDARLAVDLSKVSQINSAGLSDLINVVARARLSGSRVVLISPSPFIRQVFEMTRLDEWFDIVDDLAAAERILGA